MSSFGATLSHSHWKSIYAVLISEGLLHLKKNKNNDDWRSDSTRRLLTELGESNELSELPNQETWDEPSFHGSSPIPPMS